MTSVRRGGDMTDPRIPLTAHGSVVWPAVPAPANAALLALMYQFEQCEWWPPETLLAMQLRQLESVLAHAARTVPFYQQRLRAVAKLRPGGLTMETWRRLPPRVYPGSVARLRAFPG